MAKEIKIGIVEDELLIAEKIKMILEEFGYSVCEPVSNYDEALEMINREKPDFMLLDINLRKEKDGIDIAQQINENYRLPFIFLTANSDMATIERAKTVRPYAYLVKPFTKEELFAAIEIAVNNFNISRQEMPGESNRSVKTNYLFIRDAHRFIKIQFDDIAYIESKENYVTLFTTAKKNISFRSTFNEFLVQLPAERFYRVHRSFAIRTDLVENIDRSEVIIAGTPIPISNSYRDGLFECLGIKQ